MGGKCTVSNQSPSASKKVPKHIRSFLIVQVSFSVTKRPTILIRCPKYSGKSLALITPSKYFSSNNSKKSPIRNPNKSNSSFKSSKRSSSNVGNEKCGSSVANKLTGTSFSTRLLLKFASQSNVFLSKPVNRNAPIRISKFNCSGEGCKRWKTSCKSR